MICIDFKFVFRTGDDIAVKLIRLQKGDDFAVLKEQVQILTQCIHPNIVTHYGCFISSGKLWIVMEYCYGGSLRDIYSCKLVKLICAYSSRFLGSGPLSELQIAFVSREILRGLEYLHESQQSHRDIKGANVLITKNGDVKLADFGVGAQITAAICKRKVFIGSPYWYVVFSFD